MGVVCVGGCRDERQRKAKQRKREWLLKMYRMQVGR
jgi:hypothetical protein